MKKIVLILASELCLGAAAVQAQDPAQQPTKDSTSIQPSQPATPAQPDQPSYLKDMVKIEATEIPAGLQATLQRDQFKGWESGSVYKNQTGDVYIVEINDAVENRTKAYRFDASGKPIKE